MRGAKAEGKIKGPAHTRPQSQSARGLGAAPRRVTPVLRASAIPYACDLCRVLLAIHYATPRQSLRHDRT